jgi:hypothetical protein
MADDHRLIFVVVVFEIVCDESSALRAQVRRRRQKLTLDAPEAARHVLRCQGVHAFGHGGVYLATYYNMLEGGSCR